MRIQWKSFCGTDWKHAASAPAESDMIHITAQLRVGGDRAGGRTQRIDSLFGSAGSTRRNPFSGCVLFQEPERHVDSFDQL